MDTDYKFPCRVETGKHEIVKLEGNIAYASIPLSVSDVIFAGCGILITVPCLSIFENYPETPGSKASRSYQTGKRKHPCD